MGAIYRLTENEDRAIIWQTDRQTDRQTDKISLSFSAFLHTGKNNKHIIFVEADKS